MARRYLTAEDVRRSGGPEIVVDADTVVTPQALDVAEAAGIAIRTGSGAWSEPAPDRGPDAERSRRSLPGLPVPEDSGPYGSTGDGSGGDGDGARFVVTVVGRNRSGVLAEITRVLADMRANVNDISQRIIEGYFHLILTAELAPGTSFDTAKQTLECMGGESDYAVRVMHERVFHFMHRV